MEFTGSGARGGQPGTGGPRPADASATPFASASETRPAMSFFATDPLEGASPEPGGPVLVMPPPPQPTRKQLWLQRTWRVVFVLFCLEIGIILTALPWTR